MIEGLKVTVDGNELRELCVARAEHHRTRAAQYAEQLQNFVEAQIEGMSYSNGDPKRTLADKQAEHDHEHRELTFIAEHLDTDETYLLDRDALRRLGIVGPGRY